MRHHKLVMPGDLNHYGHLFGGHLLKWVDEFAWITASRSYPGRSFVTIAMDKVTFREGAGQGDILIFDIEESRRGRTSVQYQVDVVRENLTTGEDDAIFSTHITFVNVDDEGRSVAIDE